MTANEIDEIIDCSSDEQHFISTHFKAVNPFNGLSTLQLTPKQINILNRISSKRYIIDAISERQIGTSTILAAHALWLAMFQRDQRIVIMSNDLNNAKEMRALIKIGLQNLPEFLKIPTITDNAGTLEFENNSWIYFTNANPDHLRGSMLNYLILNNADFFSDRHRLGLTKIPQVLRFVPEKLVAA